MSKDEDELSWDGLSSDEQRFVEEYMVDGNPVAAAKRAGLSVRLAGDMMAKPHVQAAIQRLQDAAKVPTTGPAGPSREALIKMLQDSYDTAQAAGNSSAMTMAAKALADLAGHGGEQPKPPAPVELNLVGTAKAVSAVMREAGIWRELVREEKALAALQVAAEDAGEDPFVGFDARGFDLNNYVAPTADVPVIDPKQFSPSPQVKTPDPVPVSSPDTAEPEPAVSRRDAINDALEPAPYKPVLRLGEREVFNLGVFIEYARDPGSGNDRYLVYGPNDDAPRTLKRSYADAVTAAEALVKHLQDGGA